MSRLLLPTISILAGIGILFFFVQPINVEIKEIQTETSDFAEAVSNARQFNQELQSLISDINFGARELERLDAFVPKDINEIGLVIDLEALVARHGFVLDNVSVSFSADEAEDIDQSAAEGAVLADIEANDFEITDIGFSVLGEYEQMRNLLEDLERSLVLMEIVDLNFAVDEGELQNYNFTVRAYALRS